VEKVKLILALPGNEFRSDVMLQTIKFINYCESKKIDVILSMKGGSNVSIVRERCLGLEEKDILTKESLAPFYGKIDYDYILWVDSDIGFRPEDFEQLLSRNVDIIAGPYKKAAGAYTCTELPKDLDIKVLPSMTPEDLKDRTELIEALSFGFGFVLIKRGVFEKVPRPWFCTQVYNYRGNDIGVGEDVYFCLKAKDAGFKLWIDPLVKLYHIKSFALQGE
jgi:hypothetical protein